MSRPLLESKGIHKSYMMGRFPLHVLCGVDMNVEAGEFVAIMGASGSGKSTLLHILGAVDAPDKGSVSFDGTEVGAQSSRWRETYRNRSVGFVFQFYHLLPELNVFENILLPRMVGISTFGWFAKGAAARADTSAIMEKVGLADRAKHRPNELSGGERQRAAIARALVNHPKLLLADEPTGNLDATTGKEILEVLEQLNREGQTIVMVTHDANIAARASRRVNLVNGKV
ncbi:MAG: ABC transporter ATP-binding protein [Phycisphaerae bacterium]|nr:ABC transporter ATP-binding protein [Phycisphaerae bacterium]